MLTFKTQEQNKEKIQEKQEVKKELLFELLKKRVAYQDVKRHELTKEEIEFLHTYDYMTRSEYTKIMQTLGYSNGGAYHKWKKAILRNKKNKEDKYNQLHTTTISALRQTDPVSIDIYQWYFSAIYEGKGVGTLNLTEQQYIELLKLRDKKYEKEVLSTREVAKILGVTHSKIHMLFKEKINIERGISKESIIQYVEGEASCALLSLQKFANILKDLDSSRKQLFEIVYNLKVK